MFTTLFICLFLGINAHIDNIDTRLVSAASTSISTSTTGRNLSSDNAITSPPLPVNITEELVKISTTCLSIEDLESLTGNVLRYDVVQRFIITLLEESVEDIGLRELRKTLKLPPPAPWQRFNRTKPAEHELTSASTIEEYYKLKEPRSKMRSLNSRYLYEHNVATAVAYLNKRVPSIRTIFKKVFEDFGSSASKVLNKKTIDSMIEASNATLDSILKATRHMIRNYECQNEDD
uniref:Secreted protein n=1 Tax=Caenorhabditis tropicalis TaxID=1561998 RepID=A0A1I7T9T3_9PELO